MNSNKQQKGAKRRISLPALLWGMFFFPPLFLLIYWGSASLLSGIHLVPDPLVMLLFFSVLYLFPAGVFLLARWIAYSFVNDVAVQLSGEGAGGEVSGREPFRVFRIEQEAGMLAGREEELQQRLAAELHELELISGLWSLGGRSHFHFPIAGGLADSVQKRYKKGKTRAAERQAGVVLVFIEGTSLNRKKAVENSSRLVRRISGVVDKYGGFIYRGYDNCWEILFSGEWDGYQTAVRTMKSAHELFNRLKGKYTVRITADYAPGREGLWRMPGYLRYFFETPEGLQAVTLTGKPVKVGLYLSHGLVELVKEGMQEGKSVVEGNSDE